MNFRYVEIGTGKKSTLEDKFRRNWEKELKSTSSIVLFDLRSCIYFYTVAV